MSALLIASVQCDEDSSFSLCVGSDLSFVLLRKLFVSRDCTRVARRTKL